MRRAVTVALLAVIAAGCGNDGGSDAGNDAEACQSLAASDRLTVDGDTDGAAGQLDAAVDLGVQSDDRELRQAAAALRDSGGTADFVEAMLDMNERCDELGY